MWNVQEMKRKYLPKWQKIMKNEKYMEHVGLGTYTVLLLDQMIFFIDWKCKMRSTKHTEELCDYKTRYLNTIDAEIDVHKDMIRPKILKSEFMLSSLELKQMGSYQVSDIQRQTNC